MQYELAVSELSDALKLPAPPKVTSQLLLRRSEAYSSISQQLRAIPAAQVRV